MRQGLVLLTALQISFKNSKHGYHQLLDLRIKLQTAVQRGTLVGKDAQEACPGQELVLALGNLSGICG